MGLTPRHAGPSTQTAEEGDNAEAKLGLSGRDLEQGPEATAAGMRTEDSTAGKLRAERELGMARSRPLLQAGAAQRPQAVRVWQEEAVWEGRHVLGLIRPPKGWEPLCSDRTSTARGWGGGGE